MIPPLFIAMPGNERLTRAIADLLAADVGEIEIRAFPDGETYLRYLADVTRRSVTIVCTLAKPDEKMLPLIFAAETARELGADRVGLVAPYLGYMRQDRRFKPGEAVTSRQVAGLLSDAFNWLVTVDPHLHRYASLSEIYRIPTAVAHAAPLMSEWIRSNVPNPLIIGPDSESEQWVSAVAADAAAPFTVLEKIRHGDRDVSISIKNVEELDGRTPVLIDDIISSGGTMLEAVRLLLARRSPPPICIAVHGIFADASDQILAQAGARVVTSNSIPHVTNRMDLAPLAAASIREALADDVRADFQ
ncbi:ribose-phosphate pyrophosphokinase [Rhodoplanes sp. Z2-YC6860]|uniref:ribose-phosphate pyrophosphokinase n=1 Tax=Rhodoplanes sp. Z2-YC6860 TaxID=674703 RepID=UPI00078E23C3|nr:ribose-phosphate pyrophosphokinase [Rhodoplanes sp. Z2-YC6860]AMN38513.1 ribose-phosphate pyrophosphokinase [Rhodoplanes sp. Z2-YC6860]